MTPEIFSIMGVGAITLVAYLSQVAKKYIPERYHPLAPLVFGVLVVTLANFDLGLNFIIRGLVIGGLTISAFDITRSVIVNNPNFGKVKKK